MAAVPQPRQIARDTGRAASLRQEQRRSARERAGAAWGVEPEVLEGGRSEGPSTESGRASELRRRQVTANRDNQQEALKQEALSSPSGMATLDKRTGKIKEGIGGASSEEAAKQAKELRTGANSGAELAARQNRERRDMSAGSKEAARQNRMRRRGDIGSSAPLNMPQGGDRSKREESGSTLRDARAGVERLKERRETGDDGGSGKTRRLKAKDGGAKEAAARVKDARRMMNRFAGLMIIRTAWLGMPISFGHTIYIIDSMYLLGFMRKWIGFYLPIDIPEMGEAESLENLVQNPGGKKPSSGKAKSMIMKLFTLLAILWYTFWVVLIDALALIIIFFIIAIAVEVYNIF